MSEAILKSNLSIVDKRGFIREVAVDHHPDVGTSIAYFQGRRVTQFEYGIYRPPVTDDDREWEEYTDRFFEGIGGEILSILEYRCTEIFNQS